MSELLDTQQQAGAAERGRMPAAKIKTLDELAAIVARAKAQGKRVIHCHGVFDLVHVGHIRHLARAREEGDLLVVTVTQDEHVNKGPGRPVFLQRLRAESLAALECVDYVAINEWPTAVEAIHRLRPDVYVKGSEYAAPEQDVTGKITEEAQAVQAVGGRLHLTDELTFSSSRLLNDYFAPFPPKTEQWLSAFKKRYTADDVVRFLRHTATLKVLVVGEAIIDEYVFCDGLGKSTKDPVLAFRYRSTETYAGGSLAVANHLAGFCGEVGLVTTLGEGSGDDAFVRQALRPNVQPHFVLRHEAPTIHKRRFVDTHTNARMFELYLMDDAPLAGEAEGDLLRHLEQLVAGYDLVVVADYGHGMLTPSTIQQLCRGSRFLAVNTQANAGNRGFNTISKYARADYVCLAGHEVALETRMRHADERDLILEVTKRINCPRFTVTQGKDGSLHYEVGGSFVEVPALATRVTDRVGAGDAVLAVTSLLVVQSAPWDVVGFVGNVVGAQMVARLGNQLAVDRVSVTKSVISLLK
ncbi:MAG: adenylyltransferase/cytidyltransferase family protein [Candidatus Rokubacteria bacterium]|nr:adenylyltransferase/cytidyltransferase family protein [Candidatus Rokubacteria bacterium]